MSQDSPIRRYIQVLLQGRKCMTWVTALLVWLGIILFSSTALAGRVSDAAFTNIVFAHVRRYDRYDLYHRYQVHFLAEKAVHIAMFIVLATLLWRILPDMPGKAGSVFLWGTLIGCCSELVQCLFPGRDPALRDALINTAGTGIGTVISFFRFRFQRRARIRLANCGNAR